MKKTKLSFIDLETTGLNPVKHEILEIGCLVVRPIDDSPRPQWEVVDELEMKVKPTRLESAEPEALRVNGYNEGDWLFAASLEQAMKTLCEKIADTTVVAQNVAFDWSFLESAFSATGVQPKVFYHKMDLPSMVYGKLHHKPELQKVSLWALSQYFGIKNENAHTALADARTTFEIFKKLLELP
ncbi:3'-5' exonuclease [Candidatus Nomurabacteria bacterium]|nr:3'-5' exonuclease [Candidatus Nomurabacteria bacterium]